MVILHLKKTDLNQFLYETYCGIKCEDLLNELCESKYYRWFPSFCKSISF